jgi:hypothetical protein
MKYIKLVKTTLLENEEIKSIYDELKRDAWEKGVKQAQNKIQGEAKGYFKEVLDSAEEEVFKFFDKATKSTVQKGDVEKLKKGFALPQTINIVVSTIITRTEKAYSDAVKKAGQHGWR